MLGRLEQHWRSCSSARTRADLDGADTLRAADDGVEWEALNVGSNASNAPAAYRLVAIAGRSPSCTAAAYAGASIWRKMRSGGSLPVVDDDPHAPFPANTRSFSDELAPHGAITAFRAVRLPSTCPIAVCDVNADDRLSVTDAVNILRNAAALPAVVVCKDVTGGN